jgi:hypothetical protein
MEHGTQVVKDRFARRTAMATPFTITSDDDPGQQEPSSSDGSRPVGQLIDMAEWRLLPVDSALDGAA